MRCTAVIVTSLAILWACSLAGAQEFHDDFESYPVGTDLHRVGGWAGWDNDASAGAPVSNDFAYSGSKSVEILGTTDLVHMFDAAGGHWEFGAMMYIPAGGTGTTWFILLNTYSHGGNQDWSLQTQFNLDTGEVTSSEDAAASAAVVYDRWFEIKVVIDLDNNTVTQYYDGEWFTTHIWDDDVHGTIQCVDLFGNGASSVYYDDITLSGSRNYKAANPDPADGAVGVSLPLLQWTAGTSAVFHDIYFGTSPDLTRDDLVEPRWQSLLYYPQLAVEPGQTYYWRVDEVEGDQTTVHEGDVWSFTTMPLKAYAPIPTDGAATSAQVLELSWLLGQGAETVGEYRLYFGDSLDAVQQGAAETDRGELTERTFNTGLLRAGTTYHWRVDENDKAGQRQVGDVWSFTTGQPASGKIVRQWWLDIDSANSVGVLRDHARYPSEPDGAELLDLFEGPLNWAEAYGSRLYGWLVPPESGAYTFWIASDDHGELWLSTDEDPAHAEMIANVPGATSSREWTEYESQKSAPITLQADRKYYIEAVMKEATGGDNIAVAWKRPTGGQEVIPGAYVDTYALLPVKAATPFPKNGAVNTFQSLVLSWFAGEKAAQHDVYFGDDAEAVTTADNSTTGIYRGRHSVPSYGPGPLAWGKTYYWRVDEINTTDPDSPWIGTVWSFTTADFIPVDDFEGYTEDVGTRVFETWIYGHGFMLPAPGNPGNGTGAAVGHDIWGTESRYHSGLLMETRNAHGGDRAMPLYYNNAETPYYSETVRTWTTPQNWTVEGVETLSLWIRGRRANSQEALYVAVEDAAGHVGIVINPDSAALLGSDWARWEIALSDLIGAGVNLAAVQKMGIGVGSRMHPTPGGTGVLSVDDIRVK